MIAEELLAVSPAENVIVCPKLPLKKSTEGSQAGALQGGRLRICAIEILFRQSLI
jgi:hypothetical protein